MAKAKYTIPTTPKNPLDYAANISEAPILEIATNAIEQRQMLLAYQPIMHSDRPAQPAFYEGLLRILDQNSEVIPAAKFVPLIEDTELGRKMDCHALELGLEALAREPNLRLSINMSARSVGYPMWLETLRDGLDKHPRTAERLILEITEASVMAIPELVVNFIGELQKYGISFALDDFGAGYTAFRYFKDFQFDIVKIDGQFVKNIHKDPDNQVLTAALISISKHFDMFTVAEHVETAEEMAYLQKLGIDCLQGYHLGRPELVPEWTAALYDKARA